MIEPEARTYLRSQAIGRDVVFFLEIAISSRSHPQTMKCRVAAGGEPGRVRLAR